MRSNLIKVGVVWYVLPLFFLLSANALRVRETIIEDPEEAFGFASDLDELDKMFPMSMRASKDAPSGVGMTCGEEGICIDRSACIGLGGIVKGICPSGGVCCHSFKKGCSHVTEEMVSHFFSPEYPRPVVGTLLCQYDIQIQDGICGVRLDFLEFNTSRPVDRGLCTIDQLFVLNSLEGASFGRCGDMTGYASIYPVDASHKMPLTLLSIIQSSEETFKWNIRVSQIKCNQARKIKDSPACNQKFDEESLGTKASLDISSEPSNTLSEESKTYPKSSRIEALENIFYIEYLKRAHQAIIDQGSNPNTVTCKNSPLNVLLQSTHKAMKPPVPPEERERIIRGADALPYEFPWLVSIQDRKSHVCGGSIISEYFIVTASHCFLSSAPVPLGQIRVVVGDLNLNSTTEVESQIVEIHSLLFHSHFDPYYLKNDIALIRLRKPLKFRRGIQPICLPKQGELYADQNASIAGWGATHYPAGKLATHLQWSPSRVIKNEECRRVLRIDYLFPSMMCAVSPECGGTCFGDSGGPLHVTSEDGRTQLAGVVSFGIGGCALFPYWPDVYTRLSEYLDWLSYATILY